MRGNPVKMKISFKAALFLTRLFLRCPIQIDLEKNSLFSLELITNQTLFLRKESVLFEIGNT